MTSVLKTTSLGEIRGKHDDGVVQYLGLKYASLKNRLADAELVDSRKDGSVLDATKDGPTAVSPLFGCDLELGAIQHTLPKKDLPQSDLDCLNLNIAVPAGTTATSRLPVFVFIHGGGLIIGANSWPQFDYARFVKLSAEMNLPIVAVSINYRLGAFGFLTSEELRKAGYKANNGLRDQRVALQWIQKHIQDFGGDPENVTLTGMSAGGASVTYHLHSDEPLFKRAIVMSGTYFLTEPQPYEMHEQNYQKAMEALGLSNATADERLRVLLETPGQELISKIPPSVISAPAIDGDVVLSVATHAETSDKNSNVPKGKAWCKELMIGDAQMDASIMPLFMSHLKEGCGNNFVAAINKVLANVPTSAQQILESYGIKEDMPDEEAFSAILNYSNDISSFIPVLSFAEGWPGKAYVYYFNEGNPWEGPCKNKASHILDLAYLFQNFREFMTPAQQSVATAFAKDVFKFCHGVVPWPAVTGIQDGFTARTYGPSSNEPTVGQVKQAYGRESKRRTILCDNTDQVPQDDLAEVLSVFKSM
ncbi:Carboxylesterase [Aspergillus sclerotialis]|uniref:Carboxylic ester hydrolase n=1 Tax=Aspergillus sclerotialis TaxID=2070753 RepID=A0A3A3A3D3_9EURO|nr:Carboxylesterase [Aspergillus sclerotialis]